MLHFYGNEIVGFVHNRMSQLLRNNGQKDLAEVDDDTQTMLWILLAIFTLGAVICVCKRKKTVTYKATLVQELGPDIVIYSLGGRRLET